MIRRGWSAGLVGLVFLVGCYQTLPEPPAVYPVRGKVLQSNGQPMPVGTVKLTPKDPKKSIYAEGRLQKDGTFSVFCFSGKEGAVPGEYMISFDGYNLAEHGPFEGKPPEIPAKYKDPSTSELTVLVKAQDNTVDTITLK